MPARSLVALFIAPLNAAGIEYMVTGGLAAVVYGHPRLTLDVDLVLRMTPRDGATFATLWSPDEFYSPPAEVLAAEIERPAHGHFNVVHTESAMRADVYLAGSDDLIAWALENHIVLQVEGEAVRFAPIEYVIAYKLQYFRMGGSDRHLRDVARMIEVSDNLIDASTLNHWLDRRDLAAEWDKARAYVGRP